LNSQPPSLITGNAAMVSSFQPNPCTSHSMDTIEGRAIVEAGYNQASVAGRFLEFSLQHAKGTPRDVFLDKVLSSLPPDSKILELGCGAGVLCTKTLLERGHIVTAVDISSAQIDLAKENLQEFLSMPVSLQDPSPRLTLLRADMTTLRFAPESFDAVLAFYSFFHLPQSDQPPMVRRIASWIKPGRWFLANFCPKPGNIVRDNWFGTKMFSAGFGRQENSQMIEKEAEGMKIVQDEVIGEINLVKGMGKTFQWVLAMKE